MIHSHGIKKIVGIKPNYQAKQPALCTWHNLSSIQTKPSDGDRYSQMKGERKYGALEAHVLADQLYRQNNFLQRDERVKFLNHHH